jgi:formylglycine-generating enzyme required for sulfatase activity/SH3-like domain-containing protein
MDFAQVEAEFQKLKGQYEAGALTEAELRAELEKLMLQDEQGCWWMIGYETGQWYYHDGTAWVRREPPEVPVRAPPAPPVKRPIEVQPASAWRHNKALWICAIGALALLVVLVVRSVSPGPTPTPTLIATTVPAAMSRPTTVPTQAPIPTTVPTATPKPTPQPDAVVREPSVELREGPGSAYAAVSSCAQGTELIVLGRSTGSQWLKVRTPDGQVGWVRAEYLQVSSAPAPTATATPAFTRISLQTVGMREESNLGLAAGARNLLDIPFEIGWKFTSQSSDHPEDPTGMEVVLHIVRPVVVHLLLQGGWTTGFLGKTVGSVSLDFADGTCEEILVVGSNIRDWNQSAPGAVTSASSARLREAWRGASAGGDTGVIDVLSIPIPSRYADSALERIRVVDQSVTTVGSKNPCLLVLAITVQCQPELGDATVKQLEKAGITLVYVPAGDFLMGSTDSDSDANADEKPQHRVYVDGYWIGKTEVTQAEYIEFIEAGGYSKREYWTDEGWQWKESAGITQPAYWTEPGWRGTDHPGSPVVGVSWYEAAAFAKWAGGRLPTEAEWEKAARGTDGRIYPWGDTWDGTRLNFCDTNCSAAALKDTTVNDGSAYPANVGVYALGASPCGALDMAGNVSEWTADWYSSGYYSTSPERNPSGPDSGDTRMLRGGSWVDIQDQTRCAFRIWVSPVYRGYALGFRVAE